jgi:acetyl-CoA decarbonylase/synthase complex subunit epsilon
MKAAMPYHQVNVLTGFKTARLVEDPAESAKIIKRAKRPLFVVGARILEWNFNGKYVVEYVAEIARAGALPICATAHTKKKLLELGITPESTYDIVEIINHLKDKDWRGVKGEGNHDLVVFIGVRADLANQGLSTLKHFAPHLRTMTLSPFYYPNASYSWPNIKDEPERWQGFYEGLIAGLKKKDQD